MENGVEGCTQIKEDENSDKTGVRCHNKVIYDLQQSCLSAVAGMGNQTGIVHKDSSGRDGHGAEKQQISLKFWR